MVDTHYDLLSICYTCYLKNDYTKIEKYAEEIKRSGIKGIFANLYFMSEEEMKKELHPKYFDSKVKILDMFKISKQILESYLPDIDFIYSIEGCDYLDISDLDDLYNEGLRSIILVWNNKSKYGSGNVTEDGLTKEGIKFLNKAIDLNIGIDLSHANKKTFYGMIEVIKENQRLGKSVVCYASHSNCRKLCDRKRNLDDDQIKSIKEVGGLIGLLSSRNFVTRNTLSTKIYQKEAYLKHVIYLYNLLGVDNIMLSTDDMRFLSDVDIEYNELAIFDYNRIVYDTKKLLLTHFNLEETNKIMYENVKTKVIDKLKPNNCKIKK